MLKIPTFIIGGLLILTGLAGYLFQDQGLSVKLSGPLADDAEFTLSDGNDSISVDLGFPSSKSAGEYAFWIVHRLNLNHAKDRSQANYAVEQGSTAYETQSFWHASSKGDTQKALVVHAETGELGNLAETDANRSTVRLVYKNFTANASPVTLTSTNWTNIESKTELKPGDSLQFSKSWTAFIPGIIGIILIALVQGAEMQPNARKHIMHVAVLIGLIGFIMLAFRMLPGAISEMSWLKGETYGIIHASSLKATTMLASAGLLLVFVILCVVSFITARKEMAAQAKAEAEKKKKVLNKVKAKNKEADTDEKKAEKNDKKENATDDKKKEGDKKSDKDVKDPKSKDSDDKKDSSKDSDKKNEKENDSDNKEESKESKKEDGSSKTSDSPNPEAKKEPAKTEKDSSEPIKEDKPPADKKSPEASKSTTDNEEKKSEEPSKEAPSSKDSTSSLESDSKVQDESKEENEAALKPKSEEQKEDKPELKSDSVKSEKE
jgi:chemotaxis protein histidine kinase CheA